MTAAAAPNKHLRRWKRRSRTIAVLRKVLPSAIVLLILGMASQVIWNSLAAKKGEAREQSAPIRMINPRFQGRDEQGRSFMIAAREARRDDKDLTKIVLDHPNVALAPETATPSRVSAASGVYTESDRILRLDGAVRIEDGDGYRFASDGAIVDTKAGTVVGAGSMIGDGPSGQMTADSYEVQDRGDRMIFKGGVRAVIKRD
jgi:lipopolysaccharide export system protein LptC